ncbi:MAG: molybdenum cofactor biosynthesis protein MoaE [Candidatus Eisenbacteria bacterium]|nr:molybdenum cofactor biosynthesis protein MoaE [Candidatus Latescibacterota bacterium]MBD3302468.1 molybdenum cofactor biosynthesis protein MoaE [Candidatus Eisenbacteria bacterium]
MMEEAAATIRVEVREGALSIEPVRLEEPGRDGAAVVFHGIVRGQENGARIEAIEYECHVAMARVQLERIARRIARAHALSELVVLHRIGVVPVGETSLYLCAVSPHRPSAFAAAQELIEELKRDVPIWKHARGAHGIRER